MTDHTNLSEVAVSLDGDDLILVHHPDNKPECFVAFIDHGTTLENLLSETRTHRCTSASQSVVETATRVLMRTPGASHVPVDPIYETEAREYARALDAAGLLRTEESEPLQTNRQKR